MVRVAGVVIISCGLVGCGTTSRNQSEEGKSRPVVETQEESTVLGEASVDSVRVLKLEAFPVEAFAYVTGHFPDESTRIERADQQIAGSTIVINLITSRPSQAVASTELVPFDHRIPLEIVGLPAGRYRVLVNGADAELVLDQYNGTDRDGSGDPNDPAINPNAAF